MNSTDAQIAAHLTAHIARISPRHDLGAPTTTGSGAASDAQPPTTEPSAHTDADVQLPPPSSYYDGPRNARLRRSLLRSARTSDWLAVRPLPAGAYTARTAGPDDYAAAALLKSRLLGNQELDDLDVTVPRQAPPGSIDMAELVRAAAQHDLGLRVTASPWRRSLTRSEQSAPIDLGLIVDTSGSMRAHMDRVATAAWALDRAVPMQTGRVQTWVFNAAAYTLPPVGSDQIAVPHAADATDALLPALHDYTRWARTCGTSRVLMILSDGMLSGDPVRDELVRLADSGVQVVGLVPHRRFVEHLSYHLPDTVAVDVMADDVVAQLAEMLSVT